MTTKRYIPHIGDTVIVHHPQCQSNGTQTVPAIVLQAFNQHDDNHPTLLNLIAFPPFMAPQHLGSVQFHEAQPMIESASMIACWRHNDHHSRVGESGDVTINVNT